jgi:hypothetical protein
MLNPDCGVLIAGTSHITNSKQTEKKPKEEEPRQTMEGRKWRPRCPEGKQGVYNEGYDYAKGETDSGRDNVG